MAVAAVEAANGSLIHVLTVEGGCDVAAWAEVAESPRAVRLTIVGLSPERGGCTAEIKERCVEVELTRPLGGREVQLADPYTPPPPASEDRLALAQRGTGCRRVPTRN
jgi:hypothetical protein